MKFRYPIALFLVSFIFFLTAMLLRITFWPGAQLMVYLMLLVQATAITWTMSLFFKPRYPLFLFLAGFILFFK